MNEEAAYSITSGASIYGKRAATLVKTHGLTKMANALCSTLTVGTNAANLVVAFDDKLVLLILASLFFLHSNQAFAQMKVLYGSSAVALPANVQEFVFSGFVLALRNNLSEIEIKDFLIQDQRPGSSAIEPYNIIQENLKFKPSAVFGFPSTHESQLVFPIVRDNHILTMFASSTNTNLRI